MSAMLKAENIVKSFGGAAVLRGVSAEVKKGEVVAIIGVRLGQEHLFALLKPFGSGGQRQDRGGWR